MLCYDVMKAKALEGRKGVSYHTMEEVFQRSDIISLHLPLVKEDQAHHQQAHTGYDESRTHWSSIRAEVSWSIRATCWRR